MALKAGEEAPDFELRSHRGGMNAGAFGTFIIAGSH